MEGKRGTRARIPARSRAYIISRAIDKPHIPRKELARKLQGELKEQGFDIPEIEVLERMISKYRNTIIDGPEDKPWGLLALTNYDITAEALPIVFDLWAYALREFQKPLTIREIKWAARLYLIQSNTTELILLAVQYAAYEKARESLGDKFISIANEVVFHADTELYADTHLPKLTSEELLEIRNDPEILKRKRHALLEELRSPEILRRLELENLIPSQIQPAKKKGRQRK